MKLQEQKFGRWNDEDRIELVKLLAKGGYQVFIGKEKPEGKTKVVTYIEVRGDGEREA